ncbi:hypothetical protein BKA61DRAFT_147726 [Leptodontidium sp. MPI-SDFR-AT-0119]|nr:hypothetical protein BKA61DRAFT_147726 [Leptodontidium sp. MPI-SDFR-AT-0119]
MSASSVPVYFEQSWAILSSIGIVNVLFGFMIIGITSPSPVSLVPVVVSTACAIANGLCYYAFYADYPKTGTVAAAAVADIAWLIQEAGLSFYSYIILARVLHRRDKIIFKVFFWTMMTVLLTLRILILVNRAKDILEGITSRQALIDHLHVGYFSSIALVECISAFFLLKRFATARRTSIEASSTSGLFSYLMRSTEIRLATLALIGFSRAVTYSFQTTAQSATTTAGQLDRFVYTLECLFPVMLFIDILASKLVVTNHIHEYSSRSRGQQLNNSNRKQANDGTSDISMYPVPHVKTRVSAMTSSQERILEESNGTTSRNGTRGKSEEGVYEFANHKASADGTILRTVEFRVEGSAA